MAKITTEKGWLQSGTPSSLLGTMKGKRIPRRRRLFAVACCRRHLDKITHPPSRLALEVAEKYAEGRASRPELELARNSSVLILPELVSGMASQEEQEFAFAREPNWRVYLAVYYACSSSGMFDAATLLRAYARSRSEEAFKDENQAQCRLIRDIFPNPFRPPVRIDPSWLTARDALARNLAEEIDATLSFARFPILGDVLEEAGCDSPSLLDHLRLPTEHVRGCWALDLLMGR